MPSNSVRVLAVLSLAVAALVAPAAAANAATVDCGDTISGTVTLTGDLHCQDTTGLTVLPGAVLDLGGHTLFGDGDVFGSPGGPGITIADAGNVTVTNGTVTGWDDGIVNADDGTPNPGQIRLTDLQLQRNGSGVASSGMNRHGAPPVDMQISDSTFSRNHDAIDVQGGRVTVHHSYLTGGFGKGGPVVTADWGVVAYRSVVTVRNSTFQRLGLAISCYDSRCSLTDSVVRDGESRTMGGGVQVSQSSRAAAFPVVISGNRFSRLSGAGVFVEQTFALVTVTRNRFVQDQVAVGAFDISAVNMTHNDVRDGTFGFYLDAGGFQVPGGHLAVVAFNTFAGNHDGVYVRDAADPSGLRLGSNAAVGNVDYGIYAPGASDRGGNTASGNGHDPQCVGVVCT